MVSLDLNHLRPETVQVWWQFCQKCNHFRLKFCSWILNFSHNYLIHYLFPQILSNFIPNGGSCNVSNKDELCKDMSRSCGRIATTWSYLPFPQFLPSEANNWYYAETELCSFYSTIFYKFLRKWICLHGHEIQDLDERWGSCAVICHWQWQITFGACYRVMAHHAKFWIESFVLIIWF